MPVKVDFKPRVTIEMSLEQAKFLYDLLYRNVAGSEYYNDDTKYWEISEALKQAGITCDRMNTDGRVLYPGNSGSKESAC